MYSFRNMFLPPLSLSFCSPFPLLLPLLLPLPIFFFPISFLFISSPSLCPWFGDKSLNFSEAASALGTEAVWDSGCCRLCACFGSNCAVTLAFVAQVPLPPSLLLFGLLVVELVDLVIRSWVDGSEFPIYLLAAVHFFPTGLLLACRTTVVSQRWLGLRVVFFNI